MEIVKIKSSKIVPYEKNVKRHSQQQIEKIAKSIQEVGFIQPIVVDEENIIIIGHGRFEAMKFLGYKDVDCVILKGLTDSQKKALRIRDNKLNESPFDFSNLKDEMSDIFQDGGIDLQDLGFSLQELEELQLSIKDNNQIEDDEDGVDNDNGNFDNQDSPGDEKAYNFSNVQGAQSNKQPLTFFLSKEEFAKLQPVFATGRKWESDVNKLIEIVDFYFENHK